MTSISPSYDDYLMHHGVKGMKWGVRKKPEKPTYRLFGKGIVGDKNYESDDTVSYKNAAKRYEYKAQKYRYRAHNSNKGSKAQNRRLNKAKKFENKANIYRQYAEASSELDKKASSLARKTMPKANSEIKKYVRDVVRNMNESRYQMNAAEIGFGERIVNYTLYGSDNYSTMIRDNYIRRSVKKKNKK